MNHPLLRITHQNLLRKSWSKKSGSWKYGRISAINAKFNVFFTAILLKNNSYHAVFIHGNKTYPNMPFSSQLLEILLFLSFADNLPNRGSWSIFPIHGIFQSTDHQAVFGRIWSIIKTIVASCFVMNKIGTFCFVISNSWINIVIPWVCKTRYYNKPNLGCINFNYIFLW